MGEPRHWHLFMYDISEDRRRSRVHATLKRWGRSLQYSIFCVHCTARELARIRFELSQHLGEGDRLTVVRLCNSCAERVAVRGEEPSPFESPTPPFHLV